MNYIEKENDKICYLRGLIRIAKADQTITQEEKNYYEAVARGFGLDKSNIEILEKELNGEEKDKLVFSNKSAALFFIQEAIQIAFVDGIYHESEKAEIRNVANDNCLDLVAVDEFEKWVAEGIAWQKKGEEILNKYQ